MPKLFLFPCLPDRTSGYGKAVLSDLKYYAPSEEDYVVFISDRPCKPRTHHLHIRRNNWLFRLLNLVSHGHPSVFCGLFGCFVLLVKFRRRTFDYVFVGDVNFFYWCRYLRAPRLEFRLHNFYSKMYSVIRKSNLQWKDFRLLIDCSRFIRVEEHLLREVKKNPNATLLFISAEERQYCVEKYGYRGEVLYLDLDSDAVQPKRDPRWNGKLVWFGGISIHKRLGIQFFIENIYRHVKWARPEIVLELYGKNSAGYTDRELGITGLGFVKTFTYADHQSSLFINPDLVGGGVKLKLHDLYENNMLCLSTPVGIEGCTFIRNWPNITICEIDQWQTYLMAYGRCK